jgi:hypothetical protein
VSIEPPKRSRRICQSYRCQLFGHTKDYCKVSYKCAKRGGPHEYRGPGLKSGNKWSTCANCQGKHPSNYRERVYHLKVAPMNKNKKFQLKLLGILKVS